MGRIITAGGQRFLIEGNKVRPIVAERYTPAMTTLAAAPAPEIKFVGAREYKRLQDLLGEAMPSNIQQRPGASTSVRASRATGVYHCQFFGQDYKTVTKHIHHPADCGLDKTGNYTSAQRLAAHLAWCDDAPANVLAAIKAAK